MSIAMVTIHYPDPSHYSEFVARVQRAVAVLPSTPGCLAAECWVTAGGEMVVSTGRWESEAAMQSSFAAARAEGVDFDYDEREARPRQVLWLIEP